MKNRELLLDIFWEVLGSILIATAIYNFAVYAQFPMTGFSGIALIFYRLFNLPVGFTTIMKSSFTHKAMSMSAVSIRRMPILMSIT